MKKCLFLLLIISNFYLFSQRTIEVGGLIGSTYYLGDVNHTTQLYSGQFAAGGFVRRNINKRVAYRLNVSYGRLHLNDTDFKREYQKIRNYQFETSLLEFALQAEFNFLPYRLGINKHTSFYTPYIAFGVGWAHVMKSEKKGNLILPMGVGFKFSVSTKMELGCEWSFRKTFSDVVDNFAGVEYDVLNMDASKPNGYRQKATYYSQDWYAFIGLFITYKLFQSGSDCKVYDY